MIALILLTTIFSLIFALIFYGIGYYSGDRFLKINLKRSKVDFFRKIFDSNNQLRLLVIRLIPFSRTYVSVLSGMYKQNFYMYLLISFVSIFIWNSIIVLLGFTLIVNMNHISYIYDNLKILIFIILNVSIISILFMKQKSKKR